MKKKRILFILLCFILSNFPSGKTMGEVLEKNPQQDSENFERVTNQDVVESPLGKIDDMEVESKNDQDSDNVIDYKSQEMDTKSVKNITAGISNKKDYYTVEDKIEYLIEFETSRSSPLSKGDTITINFSGDSTPFTKVSIDDEYFEVKVSEDNNDIILIALQDINFDSTKPLQTTLSIIPSRVGGENVDPKIGNYSFTSIYRSEDNEIDLGDETYQVKNSPVGTVDYLANGSYATSIWGSKPSEKYKNNYISGGLGGGKDGIYKFNQPVQTFGGGIVNGARGGEPSLVTGTLVIDSTNPIDPDTFTIWDGKQGSVVENTNDYNVEFNTDYTKAIVSGGKLSTGIAGENQTVVYNFSVLTPVDNNASTTVKNNVVDAKLNGKNYSFKEVSNTARFEKTDNGKLLPSLSSKSFVGSNGSTQTINMIDHPGGVLITEANDFLDGDYKKSDIDYIINGDSDISNNNEDKELNEAFKRCQPGVYYVHFELINSSGGVATSVSKVTITYADSEPITIHYNDEQGNSIAPDDIITGMIGDAYAIEPINIPEYIFKDVQGKENGVFSNNPEIVIYTYYRIGEASSWSLLPEDHMKFDDTNTEFPNLTTLMKQEDTPMIYNIKNIKASRGVTLTDFELELNHPQWRDIFVINKESFYIKYNNSSKWEQVNKGKITLTESEDSIKYSVKNIDTQLNKGENLQIKFSIKANKRMAPEKSILSGKGIVAESGSLSSLNSLAVKNGELRFEYVPDIMSFEDSKISNRTVESSRKDKDWKITVEDTRLEKKPWRVTTKLLTPFKDTTGTALQSDILLFRKAGQEDQWINNTSETDVYDGTSTKEDYYDVSWSSNEGPLIQVAPGIVKVGQYTGVMQWSLIEAPV